MFTLLLQLRVQLVCVCVSTTVESALVELCVEYLSVSCQAMRRLRLNRPYLPFICNATHFAFGIRGSHCIVSSVVILL